MPTPLQSASGTAAATSVTATFSTANLSAGSKIIAIISVGATSAPAITGVTATGSNVLTQCGTAAQANARSYIYAVDASGDGSHASMVGTKPTITVTCGSTVGLGLVIQEVPGLAAGNTTAAMLDGTAAALNGTTASTGSPSYTSSAAGLYLVSAYGDFGTGFTVATAGGWTADPNNVNGSTNSCCLVQYKNSTGGAETDGFTNADTGGWAVVEVAFKLAASAPVQAAAPGQTWLRRFHHRQALLAAAPASAAAAPNGAVQPLTTRQPRRYPSRGVWRGTVSATTNLYNGTVPPKPVVARRAPARAVWRGYTSATTNLRYGNQPGGVVYRRKAARAFWRGYVSATTNLLNGNPPGGLVKRRAAARAVVRGGPAPFPPPGGTPPLHLAIARRAAARAVWRGYVSATTNLLYGNQPGAGLVRRRAAARAVVHGNPAPFPPPSGTAPDHLVVARRSSARAVWRGYISSTSNLQYGNQPGSGLVRRRAAARAVWRPTGTRTTNLLAGSQPGGPVKRRAAARVVWAGATVRTVNVTPTVSGATPDHLVVARRAPARAVVHGTAVSTVNQPPPAPAPAQRVIIPRRGPARAVARGNPVPAQPARPSTGGLVRRRAPARGQWHGGAGQPPAPPGTPARGGRVITRRPPSRGQWHGVTARTTNALPVPVAAPRARTGLPRRTAARAVWRGGAGRVRPPVTFTTGQARQLWAAGGVRQQWAAGPSRQEWAAGQVRQQWTAGPGRQEWGTGRARN